MKVIHVFISMPVGGAEDLVLSLLRRDDITFAAQAVCLRELGVLGEEAHHEGLPVHRLPVARRRQFNPVGVVRLARWFRAQQADVIHSHVYNAHLYAVPAAKLAGLPCVLHHHKTFNPRRWLVLRALSRFAECHITLSETTRADVLRVVKCAPGRVVTLPNSVDTSVYCPTSERAIIRQKLGLGADGFLMGGIAALTPPKNHAASIVMWSQLAAERSDFHGIICGEGLLRPQLERQIAALNLGERVRLVGNQRPIHPWLQALDLLVFPSIWEGQPMVLLQAMACDTAVIASNIEGNVAALGGEHPGLFPVNRPEAFLAQVRRFVADLNFRKEVLSFQRQRFSKGPKLGDYMAKLHSIYQRLLARQPPA
jgi:glycosyltransferase involved in cell wall biosynthesis